MGTPVSVQAGDRTVGYEAEPLVVGPISRTHVVRYAGASGDFTPIHHDEPLAQKVGLPGVFSMGMMQGGMLAHLVADWLGLATVRRFSIRFEERVWPGDELTFTGRVVSVDQADGYERVTVEVACHTDAGTRALSGTAVAEYPA
jgi:acyl dehydratase